MTYGTVIMMLALALNWSAAAAGYTESFIHVPVAATLVADWTDDDPLQPCTNQQHASLSFDQLVVPQSSKVAATITISLSLSPTQLREAVVMSAAGLHLTMQRTGRALTLRHLAL